ncbi:helix-turn-helix domain-containing protein [Halosolutus gelatinilyticus]|uniref:helix-turn-helix domain-containing protein n=1 Tax=Halosolutus gelatinilyticus TaxID=2931975 RepID=UPI001FF38582|nr:helix-turn-helix domain-containing protein [Halosolutus gelatinilyticus]
MPRATLKLKSNEALIALSKSHPDVRFEVRSAWPTDGKLRVLVETSAIELPSLTETIAEIPELTAVELRHATERSILFEANTPIPDPHGAMAESGIVPSFPLRLEDGWLIGDLTASKNQLPAFRDELEAAGIAYELVQVSATTDARDLLTDRQREVVELAIEHGYYESPRSCTVTDLASILKVHKSVVSRILHRAEARIVTSYWSSC